VPPAVTVYVTDGKIVRATYHMGKFPEQVLEEIADEILYLAESPTGATAPDDDMIAFSDGHRGWKIKDH
jgi:hypothetical protein